LPDTSGIAACFAPSGSPISPLRGHPFRDIVITSFGMAITDFGIVIRGFVDR
jgi:hypothetical protein